MKAKITLGTYWVGNDAETIELEVEGEEEFDSDEFSTTILNAIFNHEFPHYWMNYELVEEEEDE